MNLNCACVIVFLCLIFVVIPKCMYQFYSSNQNEAVFYSLFVKVAFIMNLRDLNTTKN